MQFSHRPINIDDDIFIGVDPKVENEAGFVYEAHFWNGSDSVMIRQINDKWLVDECKNISLDNVEVFHSIAVRVKMAQIWNAKADELCEGMKVMKLEKVVFAGFIEGVKNGKE